MAVVIAVGFAAPYGWRYAMQLRENLRQRYEEMHEFLAGDADPGDAPFGSGISQQQLDVRDSTTSAISTGEDDVSWAILAKATLKTAAGGVDAEPSYTPEIRALDHTILQAKGYMFPLDQAEKQTHFLLSPYPPSCPFCLPAGPSELIEVKLKQSIPFTYGAVRVKGDFSLLKGDEVKNGMFYRMDEASELKAE